MTYPTTFACDSCHFGSHAEPGELLPDGWSTRNGAIYCARCSDDLDRAYLREHGWTYWNATVGDVPDPGVWRDPLGRIRHAPLSVAVAEQQRRDGYGQMELGGDS